MDPIADSLTDTFAAALLTNGYSPTPSYDQSPTTIKAQELLFIDEAGNIGSLGVLGDFEAARCIFTTFYGRRD